MPLLKKGFISDGKKGLISEYFSHPQCKNYRDDRTACKRMEKTMKRIVKIKKQNEEWFQINYDICNDKCGEMYILQ